MPVICLEPGIMTLSYGAIRLTGVPIPPPQVSLLPAVALFVTFFVAALGEELGWSGYGTEPLQDRFGLLDAAVIIGAVWAVWHIVPLLEVNRPPKFIDIAFCFLDAEEEVYGECYALVVPRLVRGGLLVADNAINYRETLQPMLDRALLDERVDALIVPIGKGELVCRKV